MRSVHLTSVDSTNEHARRLARQSPGGADLSIVAAAQTAGRGTRGHRWISPPNIGLYMSVLQRRLPPHGPATANCTTAVATAVVDALHTTTALPVALKPVNDLLLFGQKLGGILIEALFTAGRLHALITGVGINVLDAPPLPPDAPVPATALARHCDPALARTVLTPEWIRHLADRIAATNRQVLECNAAALAGR